MNHEAQVTIKNASAIFSNVSYDEFANGVQVGDNGRLARIWIDDSDADVSVKGVTKDGTFVISIKTNCEYGRGPYLTIKGPASKTEIIDMKGIQSTIII